MNDLHTHLSNVVNIAQQSETLNTDKLTIKLMEEVGELAECILVEQGDLTHKSLKETSFGEAADVLICTIAILASHYPHLSSDSIIRALSESVRIKNEKYTNILKTRVSAK